VVQIRRVARGVHEPSKSVGVIEGDPADTWTLECVLAAGAKLVISP